MKIDERLARAVYDRVQQTLAYASSHFGYVKPKKRDASVAAAPPPPVVPSTPQIRAQVMAAAAERAELRRLTAECVAKVDAAAEAKTGWQRLADERNGTASQRENREPATGPWAAQIEKQRAQAALQDSGDAKAEHNHGWGRFLPDRS